MSKILPILVCLVLTSLSFAWGANYTIPSCIPQYTFVGNHFLYGNEANAAFSCDTTPNMFSHVISFSDGITFTNTGTAFGQTDVFMASGGDSCVTPGGGGSCAISDSGNITLIFPSSTGQLINLSGYVINSGCIGGPTVTLNISVYNTTDSMNFTTSCAGVYCDSTAYSVLNITKDGTTYYIGNDTENITYYGTSGYSILYSLYGTCTSYGGYTGTTATFYVSSYYASNTKEINSTILNNISASSEYISMNNIGANGKVLRSDFTANSRKNISDRTGYKNALLTYSSTVFQPKITYFPGIDAFADFYNHTDGITAFMLNNTLTYVLSSSGTRYLCPATLWTGSETQVISCYLMANTAPTDPTLVNVSTPSGVAYKNDTFVATCSGSTDADNDSITYYYKWSSGSGTQLQAYSTSSTYSACSTNANCNKNDGIMVTCKAFDGTSYSNEASSSTKTISNSPPTAPTMSSITPNPSYKNSTMTSTASGSTDIDGDSITYYYEWRNSTAEVLQAFSLTNTFNCNVSAYCRKNETIYAVGKAYDSTNYSTETNTSRNISNSPPSIPILTSPTNGAQTTDINVNMTWDASTDADGDVLTYGICFGNTSPPTTCVAAISNTWYNYTFIIAETNYWKVNASDDENTTAYSSTQSFISGGYTNYTTETQVATIVKTQSPQWNLTATVYLASTSCEYNISKSGVLSSTIKDKNGAGVTNLGNTTHLNWSCLSSNSPYTVTFYTEIVSQSQEDGSYGFSTTTQRRFLISSANANNVSFLFNETPDTTQNINLWKCDYNISADCDTANKFTAITYTVVSGMVQKTFTLTSNETVLVLGWDALSGGGGGGGGAPPGNGDEETNITITANFTLGAPPPYPIVPAQVEKVIERIVDTIFPESARAAEISAAINKFLGDIYGFLTSSILSIPIYLMLIVGMGGFAAWEYSRRKFTIWSSVFSFMAFMLFIVFVLLRF